ncbi:MAG: HAD hydrolase family protein [Phycisphaerae bacterium]|nr:HAD hydrolase family protein [Phycisphaerae bacterium]
MPMPLSERPMTPGEFSLLVLDFDGVMTDNSVVVHQDGTESVVCNRSDGWGLGLLRDAGFPVFVLSSETNPVVAARCHKLKIPCAHGHKDKLPTLEALLSERKLDGARVIYVGNDVNDLACFARVGMSIAVRDAHPRALAGATLVTARSGGKGAVREVCDWILDSMR